VYIEQAKLARKRKAGGADAGDEDHPMNMVKTKDEWSDDDDEAYYKEVVGEDAEVRRSPVEPNPKP
jgi:hypothetical protein